jgi:hypothetical protein
MTFLNVALTIFLRREKLCTKVTFYQAIFNGIFFNIYYFKKFRVYLYFFNSHHVSLATNSYVLGYSSIHFTRFLSCYNSLNNFHRNFWVYNFNVAYTALFSCKKFLTIWAFKSMAEVITVYMFYKIWNSTYSLNTKVALESVCQLQITCLNFRGIFFYSSGKLIRRYNFWYFSFFNKFRSLAYVTNLFHDIKFNGFKVLNSEFSLKSRVSKPVVISIHKMKISSSSRVFKSVKSYFLINESAKFILNSMHVIPITIQIL